MNKTYSLVWNQTQQCWTAVGETARRRGKTGSGKRLAAATASLLGLAALPAFALPSGEAITSGKADIVRADDGRSMNINQHTDKLITNWQDFSVANGERVNFNQPTDKSLALNRVIGSNGSQIDGQISANGRVFLVNPNGVMFGAGAQVNVGGLVASTQNLSDADFLAGHYRFSGSSTQAVVNHGTLTAADGGGIALLGARVANNGVIQAKLGSVALGAGNAFTVNFDGSGLLNVQVDSGAVDAQASNGGLLKADGGQVLMTARAAGNLLDAVVNNTGTIEARGLNAHGGKITLDGGTVQLGGKSKLDASAADAGAPAGAVTTRGERVNVAADAQVNTRAGNAAGTWTIEAANAGVGGTDQSIAADTLSRNLDTTNVALTNTQHDLTVGGPVAWNSNNALTLTSKNGNVDLQQAISATGEKAGLSVNAAQKIDVQDALKLTGRNAQLELNSRDGHTLSNDKAVVTLSGQNASYRSNGESYKVLHTLDDLRNVDTNLNGRYVLGNAIDGANANFRSIGGNNAFAGVFDGLGNTIQRLSIHNDAKDVGLFATNTGQLANLALRDITATASGSSGTVGTLVGHNTGTITNVAAHNVTVRANNLAAAGGLVGANRGGTLDHVSVSGQVYGDNHTASLGGLVGENLTLNGKIATIRDGHANVSVTINNDGMAGGLAGYNGGLIDASSSSGNVIVTGVPAMAGGLVGLNDDNGVIANSSSRSSVTASDNAVLGGLVGMNFGHVRNTKAAGKVTIGNDGTAGGFAGHNFGEIETSTANGDVVAGNHVEVGGFVGSNTGTINTSTATGNVNAGNDSKVGGLVGVNMAEIRASQAHGNVAAGSRSQAGGLVGLNSGYIYTASAEGAVGAEDDSTVGGLVGFNYGTIDGSRATGNVRVGNRKNAMKNSYAGGLVGTNNGLINASRASGNVQGGVVGIVGGLVGHNDLGTIQNSQASGDVTTGNYGEAGGLVGYNENTVANSSATGNVRAGHSSDAGGLIGVNSGKVTQSKASGNVDVGSSSHAGGLVGSQFGSVSDSSATGSVRGSDYSHVGGIAGRNSGTILRTSAGGTVSGGAYAVLGGLAGSNHGYIGQSSTSGRVDAVSNGGQTYGALVGFNGAGTLIGNTASQRDPSMPLVGSGRPQIGR
ncbi:MULTISPECIES: GLUG motif-containing protein [unclassified Burkholderia]|uniref:two-partner secretion domain-containing protein n=1 Tax=unclassified Burkholderia TaxID=2613784 RepID=UPI0014210322|nr:MULTISPECIES: GLUG motif-containing protein [unclassified Burkholderia]NIE56311.1 filamentous hemagglutinin N-terminal domain-containing protein [Burkholderia sp. Ap-955]NIF08316.1 filamentous hemagglutinin N-terminal domain-containing protein [Burkholderia sp. Ax-1735]NIG00970.1 filamentous hemagglutinin N-terminal domain-containing protein [Burkholderia sp. Tr-849]